MTEKIFVSKITFKKLEKLRPKGKQMNRVIVALLQHAKKTGFNPKQVEDLSL